MKKENAYADDECGCIRYMVIQNVWYCMESTARYCFPLLCWCGIACLSNAALPVLTTILPKVVIEKITAGSSLAELVTAICAFMGGIALLSGTGKFFTKFIYHEKFRMVSFYLRSLALKGLTTDYVNQENGAFRRLLTEGFSCCNGNYSPLTMIYDVLIALCTSILGLSVFWAILSRLDFWVIFFLAATTAGGYFLNERVTKWMGENSRERIGYEQRLNYINTVSGEIRSAKDIRLYGMACWFSNLYRDNMGGIAGWYRRLTKRLFGVAACDGLLALLGESAVYIYLLYLAWNGQITVADFVLYFGVAAGFSSWLGNIFSQVSQLNRLSLKINYFRSCLEYPEGFRREGGREICGKDRPGTIELKNVSFRYEGAQKNALSDINLKISPGEHLAVVGLNGAGKTTLVKLICGLTDPTQGQVLYDGVDIREYDRTQYYRLFSAVFQQFSLLPVTIEEIVSQVQTEQTDHARVQSCLETAGLWDKVKELPKGVDSQFGKTVYDDGIDFSGGEVQKLLLARALYRAASILLLDEPTAALDPIAESALYENYNEISGGKTSVFISHRLASTSFCDRIILLENGEIREEGTHERLLEREGKYYHLFEMQAKYYREKKVGEEAEE